MTNNNNQCDAAQNYASIQQAYKKNPGEERKPVSFTTPIQAVYDGKTGASLEAILAQFNSIYVQYQGTPQATRNIIPEVMRRAGLKISYKDMEGVTIEEQCRDDKDKFTDAFGNDENWIRYDNLLENIEKTYYIALERVVAVIDKLKEGVTPDMLSESVKQLLSEAGATITNLPDEEDITTTGGTVPTLKFKDKEYLPEMASGLGRVILRKNFVGGKNILTQEMISKPNTIYIIQYDFDLGSETLTIPEGCTLDFQGGSLSNGQIVSSSLKISGITKNPFPLGITIIGKIITENGNLLIRYFSGESNADRLQAAIDYCINNNYPTITIDEEIDLTGHKPITINKASQSPRYAIRLIGSSNALITKFDEGYMFTSLGEAVGDFYIENISFRSERGRNTKVYDCNRKIIRIFSSNNNYHSIDYVFYNDEKFVQSIYSLNDEFMYIGTVFYINYGYDIKCIKCLCEDGENFFVDNNSGQVTIDLTIQNSCIEGLSGSVVQIAGAALLNITANYFEYNENNIVINRYGVEQLNITDNIFTINQTDGIQRCAIELPLLNNNSNISGNSIGGKGNNNLFLKIKDTNEVSSANRIINGVNNVNDNIIPCNKENVYFNKPFINKSNASHIHLSELFDRVYVESKKAIKITTSSLFIGYIQVSGGWSSTNLIGTTTKYIAAQIDGNNIVTHDTYVTSFDNILTETFYITDPIKEGDNIVFYIVNTSEQEQLCSILIKKFLGADYIQYLTNQICETNIENKSNKYELLRARVGGVKPKLLEAYKGFNSYDEENNNYVYWNGHNWEKLLSVNDEFLIIGSNSQRPNLTNKDKGFQYYDTTLNKPIWWTGTKWVDATGAEV